MEQLTQKHIRYFYIALIVGIIIQLVNVIITSIQVGIGYKTFIIVFLSILNLILLISDLRHSIKQQFTECRLYAKLLRITIIPLLIFQVWLCLSRGFSSIVLGDYMMSAVMIEIVLNLKIKCINHLEKLADEYIKNNELPEGGVKKC